MSLLNDYINLTKRRLKEEIKLSDNEINELLNKYTIKSGINKRQTDYYGYVKNGKHLYLFRAIYDDKVVWIKVDHQRHFGCFESKYSENFDGTPLQEWLSTHKIEEWWHSTAIAIEKKPKESYSEFDLRSILTIEPISKYFDVIQEYEIKELTGFKPFWIGTPRFDFALKDRKTNNIIAFIEFNGDYHFKTDTGEENIRLQQRDMVKRGWAASYGIPVIDLSYAMLQSVNLSNCLVAFVKGWLKGWDTRYRRVIK